MCIEEGFMSDDAFHAATETALELLFHYGQDQAQFARRPIARDLGDPDQLINQALAESQKILNRAAEQALLRKVAALKSARARQLVLNYIHFATGSAFILLIAGKYPTFAKWVGALVAFCAGTLSIVLPANVVSLEEEVRKDTENIADLVGKISALQVELVTQRASQNADIAAKVSELIGQCTSVARKYRLERITAQGNVFSRKRGQ
jgi:hypothetical protein